MSEESPKPIVALRVVRPYDSEDQFLKEEPFAVTRTSLVLVGASSRPEGVILRFEVVLRTGAILLRGEGRVVSHGPTPLGESGLTLKFTRLDPRSKALVDRAGMPKVVDAPRPSEPPPHVRPKSDAPSPAASEPKIEETPSLPPSPPDYSSGNHVTVPAMQAVRFPVEAPTSRGDSPLSSGPSRGTSPPPASVSSRGTSPPPVSSRAPAPLAAEAPLAGATEVPPPFTSSFPPGSREAALDRLRARLQGKSAISVLELLTAKA